MDLDAFTRVHSPTWAELDALSRHRKLTGEQADRMVQLYQTTSTHLSQVRSTSGDAALVSRLTMTLLRARTRLTGGREPFLTELGRFFGVDFPAALWRLRWWSVAMTLVNLAVAFGFAVWVGTSTDVQAALASKQEINQLINHDFTSYYSEHPAAGFALQVWTNNAWVAALSIALGVFGLPLLYIGFQNMSNLGLIAGLMISHDRGEVFFGYILPHGMLELTAVFVAMAAGLKLFWSWVAPGPLSRTESMAREGRSLFTVALGMVVVLGISGILEGFVTPSGLPTWARLTLGTLAWLAFVAYTVVLGRRAALQGHTGDLDISQRGDVRPTAG